MPSAFEEFHTALYDDEYEVYIAVSHCQRGSSPGPSGHPVEFYQTFAPELMPILAEWINSPLESLVSGEGVPTVGSLATETLIRVFPKLDKVCERVRDYRPISLMNTDLKIIMQALKTRVYTVIERLVDPDQTDFIPNRDSRCNLNNVDMVLKYPKIVSRYGRPEGPDHEPPQVNLLNLDFEKAYDRPSKCFI